MADAVIVGKFVGTKSACSSWKYRNDHVSDLWICSWNDSRIYCSHSTEVWCGRYEGDGNQNKVAGILSLLIGPFPTVTFMLFMKPLLHLMNTPSDIFADAYKYIMIVSGGILAQMLYNLLSSILRALGNSKIPLYFLIISALLNIVLDLVLIIVFQMGAPVRQRDGSSTGHIRCTLSYLYL